MEIFFILKIWDRTDFYPQHSGRYFKRRILVLEAPFTIVQTQFYFVFKNTNYATCATNRSVILAIGISQQTIKEKFITLVSIL
jgi:hypothetical protein